MPAHPANKPAQQIRDSAVPWLRAKHVLCQHWLFSEPLGLQIYRLPLLWLLIALIIGVKLAQGWPIPPELSLAVLAGGLLAATFCRRRKLHIGFAAFAWLAAVAFGGLYAGLSQPIERDPLAATATRKSEPIAVRCTLQSAAVWKPNPHHRSQDATSQPWSTQWEVRCDSIRVGRTWRPTRAFSSLSVDGRIVDLYPGDTLEVLGSYRQISAPTNPGSFDFANHFRKQSKFMTLSADSRSQIKKLGTATGYVLPRARAWLVRQVDGTLHRCVPFGQAPLAAALVFGQREQVDWERQQELMATGTLHLLAISGMHVEIVASVLLLCLAVFSVPQRVKLILLVLVCGTYAALAGGQPPVLRAVLVVTALALARTLGRRTRLSNVLSLAAIVLLFSRIANLDSVGVHLSFLAVGAIGVFVIDFDQDPHRRSALQGVIEESLSGWSRWGLLCFRAIKNMAMLSLWVWLLTCPLVWWNFHVVAPVAIPLNILLAVPLTISLVSGLLTGLLGWLPILGWLTGGVCGIGLTVIRWLVGVGQAVPFGHVWLPAPHAWWIISFYAFTACWLLAFGRRRNRGLLVVLSLWLAVGIAPGCWGTRGFFSLNPQATQATPAELRCTFLDVGHGTSVVLEMPNGQVWLYDAGRMGAPQRSHQDIAAALWALPTAKIDTLLLSHPDSDHYNATLGLAERFRIGRLASTHQFWNSRDHDVVELLGSLDRRVVRAEWNAGMYGTLGNLRWRVLHPGPNWVGESDNAASLCLLVEYAGKRILLPGDLEGSGLLSLVELPERPCHVLMAPHHGSLSLDPDELLAWCRPQVVVISGNHRATHPKVLKKYASPESELGITFRDGAIQVRITAAGSLSVWHWQGQAWSPLESNATLLR